MTNDLKSSRGNSLSLKTVKYIKISNNISSFLSVDEGFETNNDSVNIFKKSVYLNTP